MTYNTIKEATDVLEGLIDAYGMRNVLSMLGDIAGEKAAHINENWQDPRLAKKWDRAAGQLNTIAERPAFYEISLGLANHRGA